MSVTCEGTTLVPMTKAATLLAALTVALVLVASGGAAVRKVSFTSVVSPNDYASLTVNVAPRARCTIAVVYASGVSKARGLGAKTGAESPGDGRSARLRPRNAGPSGSCVERAGS